MTNKKFRSGMLIMALVFGTALIGCNTGSMSAAPGDVTYTVDANGILDTETSSQLTFTFSSAVSGLTVENIAIIEDTGAAAVNQIKGNLTGGDTSWSLSITKVTAGKIRVQIDKKGVERGRKTVFVHKDGSDGSDKEHAIKLTSSLWEYGSVDAGKTKWYKFEAKEGTDYRVQWKDGNNRPASEDYEAWLKVTAYQSDGTTNIPTVNSVSSSGYTDPRPVSGVSGTVYLKVEPYRSSSAGTYAIRFYEPAGMPQVFITVESARAVIVPFVVVRWSVKPLSEGDVNVSGFKMYRSNTEKGTYTQVGGDITVEYPPNDAGKLIYIDKGVTPGNTYWYRVTAYNKDGVEGDMSDQLSSDAVPGSTPEPVKLEIGADKTESRMDTDVNQIVWYTFTAESGKTYRVQWESGQNNPVGWYRGGFADIKVSVFTSDRELIDFSEYYRDGETQGYTNPGTVSGVSGKVYLRVELDQKYEYSLGKYSLKVYLEQ